MDTIESPSDGPDLLDPAVEGSIEESEPVAVPPVVAVMVTRNPGPWLEDALSALRDQDYPSLAVLVIDAGSEVDPTPRIAAVLPGAYVRRISETVGFAAAANEALSAVEGATFLFVCHDDVFPDPTCVRILVEEAYRSNAAIVGPKLVAADRPEVLLEVGLAIDRFGVPFSDIEPGEIDQEQRDGVRDVFYVSSAAMLVRADLFNELQGFDPATFPGGEDLDLCWRTWLVGGRVLVAPDARARHREAVAEKPADEQADAALLVRNRVRVLLKAYSRWTLLWTVPVAYMMATLESAAFIVTRRADRARALFGAWMWNLRHLGEIRRSRRVVQRTRTMRDRELRYLQVGGSARLRTYLGTQLHAEDRLQNLSSASRQLVAGASSRIKRPAALGLVAFVLLAFLGSRGLIVGHVPAVGSLVPWPGLHDLAATYGSGWRFSFLGAPSAAGPGFALTTLLGTVLLGATGLAETLMVVGALPLGMLGVYRLARSASASRTPAVVAALAYGVNPVYRNSIATGRLGAAALFALAPFVLSMLLRASGFEFGTARVVDLADRRRRIIGLGVLVAVLSALLPVGPAVPLVMALALMLTVPLLGDRVAATRAVIIAGLATLVAVVLLMPWPLSLVGSGDRASLEMVFRPALDLGQVLRFQTGPAGAGWVGWGLLLVAALPLLIGTGTRLAWATRMWALALIGFALVWLPSRFASSFAMPAPEVALTLSALGIALAVGLGVGAFVDDLRRALFGWRQFASVAAVVALIFPLLGFVGDVGDGRWGAPSRDWFQELAFLRLDRSEGSFRMLWLGDTAVLPLDPAISAGGVGYALARNGPGDSRELWPTPIRGTNTLVAEAIDIAAHERTNRLGHLLAPMGVKYVAVPSTRGPGESSVAAPPAGMSGVLRNQLDLARLDTKPGMVLYRNEAWIPTRARVTPEQVATLPSATNDPNAAAQRSALGPVEPVHGSLRKSAPVEPGTVLWSESYNAGWQAESNGQRLQHRKAFGWENSFVLPAAGPVELHYGGQAKRTLMLLVQLALWLGVGWLFFGDRIQHARARRRARQPAAESSGDAS